MKDIETKEKFVELRSLGLSYQKIADKINTSKTTLIKWQHEFEDEIANLKFLRIEQLVEQYGLAKERKIEAFAQILRAALDEMNSRDLKDMSEKELLLTIIKLDDRLSAQLKSVEYFTGIEQNPIDDFQKSTEEKLNLSY